MITAFKTAASGITSQPLTEKYIVRSTSASDTTQTFTASGTVSAVPDTDAVTLLGQREVEGAKVFTAFSATLLSAVAAGTVTVRGQGSKAAAPIIMSANPADGDTLIVGLTGFTRTYTYRAKAQSTLVCYATAGLTQGDYFDVALSGGSAHRFWYDIDAAGTGAPADPGGGLTSINTVTGYTDAEVAVQTEAVLEAITNLTCSVSTNTVTIDYDILGTMTVTDGPGDALGTITTVRAGTADAANQIAIGATAIDTAANARKAIRAGDAVIGDGTGAGSAFGTGTTEHAEMTVSAISNTILTAQDRLACSRQLAWSFSQTGTAHSLGTMAGGVDGPLLATVAIGETSKYEAFTLEDEGLTLSKLPPNIDHYSDWVLVSGKPATIYIDCENVTTPITASYQTTTDAAQVVVRAGQVSIANLDNNKQIINLTEIAQYVRTRITSTNMTASSVNAKIVTA